MYSAPRKGFFGSRSWVIFRFWGQDRDSSKNPDNIFYKFAGGPRVKCQLSSLDSAPKKGFDNNCNFTDSWTVATCPAHIHLLYTIFLAINNIFSKFASGPRVKCQLSSLDSAPQKGFDNNCDSTDSWTVATCSAPRQHLFQICWRPSC